MIAKPTDIDGIEHVHRADDEPPIAQLTAPRAMPGGSRSWGIRYRNGKQPDNPFDSSSFNLTKPNREQALADIEQTIRVGSDYQLGLVATID